MCACSFCVWLQKKTFSGKGIVDSVPICLLCCKGDGSGDAMNADHAVHKVLDKILEDIEREMSEMMYGGGKIGGSPILPEEKGEEERGERGTMTKFCA